jgi:uncharacterized membrane protein
MKLKRIAKHLSMPKWQVDRIFTPEILKEIEHLIKASESVHTGEIRFVVEAALDFPELLSARSAKERAIEVFSQLHIWDTEYNNGVLVYLLLADRAVEIVADRGIHVKVGNELWRNICRVMESDFAQENFRSGTLKGINAMTELLVTHFPRSESSHNRNELSDSPIVL